MHTNNTLKLLKLQVKNINLDKEVFDEASNTYSVFISKKVVPLPCPHCKSLTSKIHDHRLQKIKHSPINGFNTFLILKKTRLHCSNCGKHFYMNYSDIVNPRFRSSNILFFKIIDDLKLSLSLKDIALINNVSIGVVTRYLTFYSYLMQWQNINTLPKHIGIDEFKGNCDNSKYLCHIFDLDTKKTVRILSSRSYSDLYNFFNSINNRNEVEVVSMDLYSTFRKAVRDKLKNANIIADRFHYTRIVASALDDFRLNLWRNTSKDEKLYFKNIKRILLLDIENIHKNKLLKIEERLNYAFEISPLLKSAYQLYQSFLRIKDGIDYTEKSNRFKDWLDDALSSTLPQFQSAANTLLLWNKEILNSFKYPYSNGPTEGKNNKIKVTKRISYGFKKTINLENRIKIKDEIYSC